MNKQIAVTLALAETIRDLSALSPLKGVPSGELYARVMGHLDIHQYEAVIAALKQCRLIEERNHLLIWKGDRES